MTANELIRFCKDIINEGHGDKTIMISNGNNGYFDLEFPFITSPTFIKDELDWSGSWENTVETDANNIVLLG